MESYLELHLCSTINLTNFYMRTYSGDWIGAITSIPVAIVINLLPFAIFILLYCKFTQLPDEDFKVRFGTIYEGLNITEKSFLGYPCLFMLRRMMFSLLVVLLPNYTFLQLMFLMYF